MLRKKGRSSKRSDYYDDTSFDYSKYWEGREYEHAAEELAISRLLSGKTFVHCVDVGGGYGRLSVLLKKYARKVTLVEPSSYQLDRADQFLKPHPDIDRHQAAADELPFSDSSVDLITMIRVMHHLPDPDSELQEISRVLTPGGLAVIEVANYTHARNRLKHILRRHELPAGPIDIRSDKNRHEQEIPFVNHNPKTIIRQLAHAGLKVERILSVSNLRSAKLKKIVPNKLLLAIEGLLQPTLAHGYFGPSVFFLVKKVK